MDDTHRGMQGERFCWCRCGGEAQRFVSCVERTAPSQAVVLRACRAVRGMHRGARPAWGRLRLCFGVGGSSLCAGRVGVSWARTHGHRVALAAPRAAQTRRELRWGPFFLPCSRARGAATARAAAPCWFKYFAHGCRIVSLPDSGGVFRPSWPEKCSVQPLHRSTQPRRGDVATTAQCAPPSSAKSCGRAALFFGFLLTMLAAVWN